MGFSESRIKDGTKLISISTVELYAQIELPGLPALPGHRRVDGGGRGSDASGIDRGGESCDPGGQQGCVSSGAARPHARPRPRRASATSPPWRSAGTQVPISTARLTMEVWAQIKDLDWSMVGSDRQMSGWPSRIWPMEKYYHHLGHSGGAGLGYNISAAVGAALANRPLGRFSLNFQPDGDLMYSPGALWTVGASQHSDADCDAQQPRLSSGGDARAAPVQPAQPRRRARQDHGSDRHLDRGARHRLRQAGIVDGRVRASARSRIRRISRRRSSAPSRS